MREENQRSVKVVSSSNLAYLYVGIYVLMGLTGYLFMYQSNQKTMTPSKTCDQQYLQTRTTNRQLQYIPRTHIGRVADEQSDTKPQQEALLLPTIGRKLHLFAASDRLYTGSWIAAKPDTSVVPGRILGQKGYASIRFYEEGFLSNPTAEVTLINEGRYLDANSLTLWLNMNFSQLSADGSQISLRIPLDVEYTTSGMTTQEFWMATEFSYFDASMTLRFFDRNGSVYDLRRGSEISKPEQALIEFQSNWLQNMHVSVTAALSTENLPQITLPNPEKGWQRYFPLNPWFAFSFIGVFSGLGGISAKIFSENIRVNPYWGKIGMLPAAIASINLVHFYYMLLYISSAYIGLRFWTVIILALLSQAGASGIVVFIALGIFQGQTGMQHLSFPTKLGVILYFTTMFLTVLFTRQIANSTTVHTWYLLVMQTGAPLQLIRYLLNKRSAVAQPVNPIQEFRWEYNICYFAWVSVTAFLLRGSDNELFLLSFNKSAGVAILLLNFLPMFLMLLLSKCGTRLANIFRLSRARRNGADLAGAESHNHVSNPVELVEINQNVVPLQEERN